MIGINVTIEGSLARILEEQKLAGEKAVKAAMTAAGTRVKADWRNQVRSAGLGGKMANTVRVETYPVGRGSLSAAALVWTKAPKIIGAHEAGALIRSPSGLWLAIPLPAAGRGPGNRRLTPGDWERKTGRRLRFIYRRGRSAILVDDGTKAMGNVMVRRRGRGGYRLAEPTTFRNRTIPIFALVPQVKLPKRLNLMSRVDAVANGMAGQIVSSWR